MKEETTALYSTKMAGVEAEVYTHALVVAQDSAQGTRDPEVMKI